MSFYNIIDDVNKFNRGSYEFLNQHSIVIEVGKSYVIHDKWAIIQIALSDEAIACSNLRFGGESNIIITNKKTIPCRFHIVGGKDENAFRNLKQKLSDKGYKIKNSTSSEVVFEKDPFTEHISNANNAKPDNRPDPRIPLPKNIYR